MSVLTLNDAKAHIGVTVSTYDAEIQDWLDAAESQIVSLIGGPVTATSITEDVIATDWNRALKLTQRFFISLTSIKADGVAVTFNDAYVAPGRIVKRRFNLPFWPIWTSLWTVTYQAGLGNADAPTIRRAEAIAVKDLWTTKRGPTSRRAASANSERAGREFPPTAGFGYNLPDRAMMILQPYMPESGWA